MPRKPTKDELAHEALRVAHQAERFRKVMHELALGNPPDATEVSPDFGEDGGGEVTLKLFRSTSMSGGVVLSIRRGVNRRPDTEVYEIEDFRQ